jgi:hypothetical protein
MLTRLSRGLRVLAVATAPACLVALPLLEPSSLRHSSNTAAFSNVLPALGTTGRYTTARTALADSRTGANGLPARLADQEFWKLSTDLSEQDGTFRSDNLVSNELWLQHVIPDLMKTVEPGRVYVGVGPEQNFTYIAALKPAMAFIIDIRRANLDLHLMYKALFEMSADRAEFVSRLFSRRRPDGLTEHSTAAEIFEAFRSVDPSETLHDETLNAMRRLVVATHRFPLSQNDWSGIEYALDAFSTFGSRINYLSTGTDSYGGSPLPSYADLMTATDAGGMAHSYLNTEASFRFMKDLESRNLVVPLVGDFAGPKTIRVVGEYLKEKGATVSAFYLSNVELYLYRERTWDAFCRNVATLPLGQTSVIIRSAFDGRYGRGFGLNADLRPLRQEVEHCAPSQ